MTQKRPGIVDERVTPCIHRGETKRTEQKSCCGTVEIFDCAQRGHEVMHTKCRSCEYYHERTSNGSSIPAE